MWCIEYDPESGVLALRLTRQVTITHMRALLRAHGAALAATGGDQFRVLADLRGLAPLDSESAAMFSEIKRSAQALPGFDCAARHHRRSAEGALAATGAPWILRLRRGRGWRPVPVKRGVGRLRPSDA